MITTRLIALGLSAALLALTALPVMAKVTEADKQKIEDKLDKNDGALYEIAKEIEKLKKESAAAIEQKKALDNQAALLQDNVDLTVELIATYEQSIRDTISEIAARQRQADEQYEKIKTYLRSSYENGSRNFLEILFSSSSLTELMTRVERMRALVSHQEEQIEELKKQRAYLDTLRTRYEEELAATQALKASLQADQAALQKSIDEAEAVIRDIDRNSQEAKKQQQRYEYAEAQLEKELQAIIDELERQAAAGIAQGEYIWPTLSKNRRISSYFGYRSDPFTGETRYHNGMDIPCSRGDPIYAINNGVVVTASYNDSYGYYIMLSHGDGITSLYAHNSKLNVVVGQVVSKGEVIAKAGSTGRSTGTHCHLEIRIDGIRVDPLEKSNRGGAFVKQPK